MIEMNNQEIVCLDSPFGILRAVFSGGFLEALTVEDSANFPGMDQTGAGRVSSGGPELLAKELDLYFSGRLKKFSVPLRLKGTPFQKLVWSKLLEIPFGKTMTYGELAGAVATRKHARAAAMAVKHNPVTILVPCHRIVASGGIGGYFYGLAMKRLLLEIEGAPFDS